MYLNVDIGPELRDLLLFIAKMLSIEVGIVIFMVFCNIWIGYKITDEQKKKNKELYEEEMKKSLRVASVSPNQSRILGGNATDARNII